MRRVPVLLLALGLPLSADPVVLRPGVPIYLSGSASGPVRYAIRDLQRDLKNVLGSESPVVSDLAGLRGHPAIVVLDPQSGPADLRDESIRGWESHGVFARPPLVVLQGSDVRGTIYAIYTFSERFLGVPPLWSWASWKPESKQQITVAADTRVLFAPPYVKWRAWFPNDEDLLTPWRARSQENFEAFLETMLRLKMNTREGSTMDPEAFDEPYRAGREARLARDRGLAFTGHHVYTLGASYSHWALYWRKVRKREPPPLEVSNVPALKDFWQYHIETAVREKLEMIWTIGFRGNGDTPFWNTFHDAPATDAERAHIIQSMMREEVELLKKVTGNPAPPMRSTLYNENSDFFTKGLLRPPDDPTLIWNFVAARRDHFPAEDIRNFQPPPTRPIGYYLNFQFTSTGAHLAQAEGPWKMEKNYRMLAAISPRPLEFSVVNAGNIREFLLELSANARMMWDFKTYNTDVFLREFCAQYFGADAADRVAALYHDFYNAYWTQKKPDIPGFERQYVFQDMRYARAIEQLLPQLRKGRDPNPLRDGSMDVGGRYFRIVPEDSGAATQLEAIRNGTTASVARFEKVVAACDALLPVVSSRGRNFLNDHLCVQAHFLLELNRVLRGVANALDALPDSQRTVQFLLESQEAARHMRIALHMAEHDRFENWYAGDRLFGLNKMDTNLAEAIAGLARQDR